MDLALRPAREGDLPFLTEVYNQAIAAGNCTCDLDPVTEADRRAFLRAHQDPRCPLFLCLREGEAVGYAYLSPLSPRAAGAGDRGGGQLLPGLPLPRPGHRLPAPAGDGGRGPEAGL